MAYPPYIFYATPYIFDPLPLPAISYYVLDTVYWGKRSLNLIWRRIRSIQDGIYSRIPVASSSSYSGEIEIIDSFAIEVLLNPHDFVHRFEQIDGKHSMLAKLL